MMQVNNTCVAIKLKGILRFRKEYKKLEQYDQYLEMGVIKVEDQD